MKRILIAVCALFAFASNGQNQDSSLLWKISGNGLSQPSYLFGTIHITCDATLDKNVMKALNDTKQMYLELDMDNNNMQMEMMSYAMMKDGKKMTDLASPQDFALVDAFLTKELGMSAKMVNNFKPAMLSMMLITKILDCPMQSYEVELMKVSKEQKEEVYGLETVAEQMRVFDDIPYQEQMDELVKSAKDNMAADKAEFKKMLEVYKTKDLNRILAVVTESENKMYGDNADVLLNNRNKNWIPKIEEVAKQTPTFFAVGAAHLGGKEGVIILLRAKGYKVEALNN